MKTKLIIKKVFYHVFGLSLLFLAMLAKTPLLALMAGYWIGMTLAMDR